MTMMMTVRLGMQIVMCVYNLGLVWKNVIRFKLRRVEWRMENGEWRGDKTGQMRKLEGQGPWQ